MARRLSDDKNTLKINDNISGSDIVFTYRMPTTKERTDYSNMAVRRKRNKVEFKSSEARQNYGLRILDGIRDGDFEIKKSGKYVPISSDPESKNYDKDWKKHIEKHAIDLIEILAAHVFEGSADIDDGESQD